MDSESDASIVAASLAAPEAFGALFDRHAASTTSTRTTRTRSSRAPNITMELQDAFYGERRYEATDLEGHRWHFAE